MLGTRQLRRDGPLNTVPVNRDVSLLTALVGAMIVSESEKAYGGDKNLSPDALSLDNSLKQAVSDALYVSLSNVRSEEWLVDFICQIRDVCRQKGSTSKDFDVLVSNFLQELLATQTKDSLSYELASENGGLINSVVAKAENHDKDNTADNEQSLASETFDQLTRTDFYSVDENSEKSASESFTQLYKTEAFVKDTHQVNVYEVSETYAQIHRSMGWSDQDLTFHSTAVDPERREDNPRDSLTEKDFEDLALENGEVDSNHITIAESSDGSYFPTGPLGMGGGGGGGGGSSGSSGGSGGGSSSFSGSVIDGYVSGATVFIDLDNDQVLDWVDANSDGVWTVGEGEAWTTTDSSGSFTFSADVNVGAGKIVSLGGTDITTGAEMTVLAAEAGSQYITPISTAYSAAGSAGATVLASMGLSAADLLYDPVTSTSANAATVLKTGSSLLTLINNASALATELGGVSAAAATTTAFNSLSTLSSSDLTKLFGTSSTDASASMTSFLTTTLNSTGVDATSYSSAISATATSVSAITTALQALSSDAVKSGELYQLAASGQSTLMADIKSLGSAAAAGEDLTAKISSLQSSYTAANLNTLKTAAAARLAFNAQDPTNPITTTADTFTLEAPVSGTPVVKFFSPLSNDKMTGTGSLGLAAVGLFDTRSFNGSIPPTSSTLIENNKIKFSASKSSVDDFYKGMAITLLTASGPIATTIAAYDGQTKQATLSTTLSSDAVKDINTTGATFLVSKAVPANISFAIVNDKIQITNTYDKDYEFGQLDLIYVAQQVGNPQVAKTGLATVNIQPPVPSISHLSNFPTGKLLQVTEAVTGSSNQKVVNIASVERTFTEVALPLKVSGLGVTGNLQIQGLPVGSYLSYSKADGTTVVVSKDVGSPNWTVGGEIALDPRIYSTLKLLIPSDVSADYDLKIFATSRYGGLSSKAVESATISISANADGLSVSAGAEFNAINALVDNTVPASGVEDTTFSLVASEVEAMVTALNSKRIDSNSERIGLRIELPVGFNASFTNLNVKQQILTGSDGKVVVQIYESEGLSLVSALNALRFQPKSDFSGNAAIQIFAGAFEPSLATNGIPSSSGAGALKLLGSPFSATIAVSPVSDTPVLETPSIVLKNGVPWSQDNYKLADGRYVTSIKTKVTSPDVDGSEKVYVDIRKAELSEAGAVVDVGGKTEIARIKQSDVGGREITFVSSASDGNVTDLLKAGTGTAQLQITQGSDGVKETVEVVFNNLSAGKTIGFGGLLFTAGSSGASATEVATAFASKAAGFSASNTSVSGGILSGTLTGWGTGDKQTTWLRVDGSAVQSIDVISPATTSKPISVYLRPVSIDSTGSVTADSNTSAQIQSITIPFEDRPGIPNLSVIPSSSGLEDQTTLFLSQFIKVDPATGRSIDTIKVFTKFDGDVRLLRSDGTQLTKSTKVGLTDYYEVDASALSTTRIQTPENFKGLIQSQTFARDTSTSGIVADTARGTNDGKSTLNIAAVADGVSFTPGTLAVDLNVGVETKLYDPSDPASSIFSTISLRDSSESFVAKLVFKNTPSDALIIKVAGKLVLAQVEGSDLVYSFTQGQLTSRNASDSITVLAKNGLFGKSVELHGISNDLTSTSSIQSKAVTFNLSATAVAPDVSLSSARGNEDTAISVPVKVAINPDRTAFEKIGFEVTLTATGTTNTNDSQNAVATLQTGKFKVGTDEFSFSDGKWLVYKDTAQLNFENLTFTPPSNYSGKIVFSFKSFSQTSSGSKTYASVETPLSVTVDPVAEDVVFKTATPITGVEDQAEINFLIGDYFDKSKLTDLGETVNIEISISSGIALKKAGTTVIPTSSAGGVSTYVLAVDVDKWDATLAGYKLVPGNNFASNASDGNDAVAAGRKISIKATSFEQSGETASPKILPISLTINPIADTPDIPRLLREAITLNESQASDYAWLDAKDAIKLSSLTSSDASETLSVQVTASNSLVLALKTGSSYSDISSSVKAVGATSTVYTLTPAQYDSLVLRGAGYVSGSADFKVKVISTESWGGSTAATNELTTVFTLKPVASGLSTTFSLQDNFSKNEDSSGVALDEFIKTNSVLNDSSEKLFYRVGVPINCKVVGLNGATLPSATNTGSGNDLVTAYSFKAEELKNFKIVPNENFSGTLGLTFQSFSQESDLSNSAFSSTKNFTLTVNPVSDAPILIAPANVSGLISNGSRISVPIQAILSDLDGSESLSVKLKFTGITATSDLSLKLDGSDLSITQIGSDYVASIPADKISKLSSLSVSSSKDFRLTNSVKMVVEATAVDGIAAGSVSTKTVDLSIYQPIGSPNFNLSGEVNAVTKLAVPYSLSMPADLPAGIAIDSLSVIVNGVPSLAYFAVRDGTTLKPIGASLGEGGVWLFKGTELLNSDGTQKPLALINSSETRSSDGTVVQVGISGQAFINDPVGGSTAQSSNKSFKVSFAVGAGYEDSSDPLVLSLGGTPISSAPINGASFELDSLLNGAETPTYWLTGDASDKSGYAFLVKPGVAVGSTLTLSDLYTDFAELYSKPGVDVSDGTVSGSELDGLSLWFDSNTNAALDDGELVSISALTNFSITVPEVAARESASGEIVSLYEAKAQWSGGPEDGGSLFSVAIPYVPNTISNPTTSAISGNNYFETTPSAAIRILGEKQTLGGGATVPEDLEGGVRFMVDLGKSTVKAGASQPIHLIKIYGVPDGVELSVGASVPAEGVPGSGSYKKSFWLVTEDSIATPITMFGFPDNYSGTVDLTAQAVASLIQGGVVQTISQASESAAAQLIVSGLADKPFLDTTVTDISLYEGGEFYLTTDGQADSEGLVSLSQIAADSNESLFVRFSLDTVSSNYVVKNYSSVANGVELIGVNGKYEVAYADLPKVKIDFSPYYSTATAITLEGISKQGVSIATADYAAVTQLAFAPVADGIQTIDVRSKEGSSITDEISLLEGGAPVISLSATTRDSKEIAEFEILIGGSVDAHNALQFVVNANEIEWSNSDDKATYLSTEWGIAEDSSFWKAFYVGASGSSSQYVSDLLELVVDEYFDGSIFYQARAISIDPISGVESDLSASPSKSGSIAITPTVSSDAISLEFLDALSREPIVSLNLNEGGESDWFVTVASSLDADETLDVDLGVNTIYFTVESRTVSDEIQYRIVHSGDSVPSNADDLLLRPSVTVSDSSSEQATVTNTFSANSQSSFSNVLLEINKSASIPVLSSTQDVSVSIADGESGGISISLPTKISDSSDDLLTYELSGVPDWLNPSAGKVVGVSENNGVSLRTYQFEQIDLTDLVWTASRTFNLEAQTSEMQWRAVHTESSNFEQQSSDQVAISITLHPVAAEPEILGPSSFFIDEAGFVELSAYSVEIPGFSDEFVENSVLVEVTLGAGTKLTYWEDPDSSISTVTVNAGTTGSPDASLTLAQLYNAKVSSIDPDYYGYTTDEGIRGSGPLSFSISAKQILGDSVAESADAKSISISIENVPEDVELEAVDPISSSEYVNEGAVYALPAFSLNGTANGEDAYVSLGVNSEFLVREINDTQSTELFAFYELEHSTYYESFYDLNLEKLLAGGYEILIPGGATTGSHDVYLYAQSFDPVTGAAGLEDVEKFSITVLPTADTPVLIAPDVYEIAEDEVQDLYFAVIAFSPDSRESVEVQITMIGPDGEPVPEFFVHASDVDYASVVDDGGNSIGITYKLEPGHFDPTYVSVAAPANFFNADADGEFVAVQDIEQKYSIQVRTRSIYQDDDITVLSSPVYQSTEFVVRAINDAPIIVGGGFDGDIDESEILLAEGTVSFSDVDSLDRPTGRFELISADGVQSDGQSPFTLTSDQLDVIANGFALLNSISSSNQGSFDWRFERTSDQLDFLGDQDVLTALFRVSVDDGFGGSDAQLVTLTITGTNDNPLISSEVLEGQVSELTSAAIGAITTTGELHFTDLDLTDLHALLNDGVGVYVSSGSALGKLDATLLSDTTGTGVGGLVRWTYSVPAAAVEYLASGESKEEEFEITFTDSEGYSVDKQIVVTIVGTNDAPSITAGDVSGQIIEGSVLSEQGGFLFKDVDFSDRPTSNKLSYSVSALKADGISPLLLSDVQKAAIEDAFSISDELSNVNNGSVTWRYSIAEESLNFLAQGETVNAVFAVQVDDGNGGLATQSVTVRITGTNDAPKIVTTGGIATGSVYEKEDLSPAENTQTHAITGRFDLAELDLSDIGGAIPMQVSAPPLGSNYVGVLTPIVSSILSPDGQGEVSWTFRVSDSEIDYLADGETLKQEYRLTVIDGAGATDTQILTITITGSNDAPVIQSALSLDLLEPTDPENLTQILPVTFEDVDLSDTHEVSISDVRISGVDRSSTVRFTSILTGDQAHDISASINAIVPQVTSISSAQITQGVAPTPKSFTTTFSSLNNGDALTIGGLTFVASRDISALEAASAFAGLSAGADVGSGGSYGSYLGALSGFTSDQGTTDVLTFTSIASGVNSVELDLTLEAATVSATSIELPTVVQGQSEAPAINEILEITFKDLVAGESVSIGGLTIVAGASGIFASNLVPFFLTQQYDPTSVELLPVDAVVEGSIVGVTFSIALDLHSVLALSTSGEDVTSLVSADSEAYSFSIVQGTPAVAAVTETAAQTFVALHAGDTLSVGGLTFTASRGTTAAETANAFAGLSAGATSGAGVDYGTYANQLVGFNSATASGADLSTVVFTSSVSSSDVEDLLVSLDAVPPPEISLEPVIVETPAIVAVTEKATQTFVALHAGDSLTVGGLTFTANRGTTATETANAFGGLLDGATSGAGSAYGTYANQLVGFNSATVSGTNLNLVVFTSTVEGSNVADLTVTLYPVPPPDISTVPVPVIIPGVGVDPETAVLNFGSLNRGDTLTINGLSFTAARDLSASETAKAFEGLQSSATTGGGSEYGTYANALVGFDSGLADGIASIDELTLLSWVSTDTTKGSSSDVGSMPIKFDAPVGSFDYLALGEEVVLTYQVTLTDASGESSTRDLTIKVVGTNDIPRIATTDSGETLDPTLVITETSVAESSIQSVPLVHGVMLDSDNNAVMNVVTSANGLPIIQSTTLNGESFAGEIPPIEIVASGALPITNPVIWFQNNELKINAGDTRFQALAMGDQVVFDVSYRVQDQHGAISEPISAHIVVNGSDDLPIISSSNSVLSASFTEIQDNESPRTETTELEFSDIRGGDTITVGGLSFTAARDLTGTEVAEAFADLDSDGIGKGGISYGYYSGSLSHFSSGSASSKSVVFTSISPNIDVTDLVSSLAPRSTPAVGLPTRNIQDGVAGSYETAEVSFEEILAGDTLTVGGLRFTADRNLSSTEVRDAFIGLSAGATTGPGGEYGVYSGTLVGFSSATVASGTALVFTAESIGDVSTISVALDLRSVSAVNPPTNVVTNGVSAQTEKIDITFNSLLEGEAITVGGLTFTADRDVTDLEVANAFQGLTLGATTGGGVTYGGYSDALTDFTSSSSTGSKVTFSPSQNRDLFNQYASTLVDFSAEYVGDGSDNKDWRAIQVLGEPDTATYGSSVTSWSLPDSDMSVPPDPQWITVGFANAVHASAIEIRETYGNGFVTRIDLIDETGQVHENVWNGVDPSLPGSPVDFRIEFLPTNYLVSAAKVYIDTNRSSGFEEIDSIRLFGYPSIIDTTASSTPTEVVTAPIDAVTESNNVKFSSLLAGESVTINGLTFTAATNLSSGDVAKAFAGIDAAKSEGVGGLSSSFGSYKGSLTGFTSSEVSSTQSNEVVFTANTSNANVSDLSISVQPRAASTAKEPLVTTINGIDQVTETTSVKFHALLAGESVTVGGLTFTAATDLVATDVAKAFSGLQAGAQGSISEGGLSAEYGTYTGALGGFSAISVSNESTEVIFTATTPFLDVPDLGVEATARAPSDALAPVSFTLDGRAGENLHLHHAEGYFYFSDIDLNDVQTVSATPIQTGLPYLGTFTPTVVDNTTGDGAGRIDWRFDLIDSDIDFLQAGETRTQTYEVTIDNQEGGTVSQNITITITGTNDAPVITTPPPPTLVDITDGLPTTAYSAIGSGHPGNEQPYHAFDNNTATKYYGLYTTGSLYIDAGSESVVSTIGLTTANDDHNRDPTRLVFAGSNDGTSYTTIHTADLVPPSSRFTDYLDVTFPNSTAYRYYRLQFPQAENGNPNIQLSEIRLIGSSGLIQNIVVGEVTEITDHAAGENVNTLLASGSISIIDNDLLDVQSVSFVPSASNYIGLFSVVVSDNTTNNPDGVGKVAWNFTLPDVNVDHLAVGETITQTYTVTVNDGNGGLLAQDVTIHIIGTNDAPTITAVSGVTDVVGAVTEDAALTTLVDNGTVTFRDVDLTDTHTVSVVKASGTLGGTFEIGDISQSATTGSGSVPWTYTVDNSATQYLAAGQTASEVFTVIIRDGNGGEVTQDVIITATGTNDAPVVGEISPNLLVENALSIDTTSVTKHYASTVIDFSSQYTSSSWSAAQVLGEPNTSYYGDIPTAWCAAGAGNDPYEWLTVGYSSPTYVNAVEVRETFNNGFVYRIDLIDINNQYHTVWEGVDTSTNGVPFDFKVDFPLTDYLVTGAKIFVNGIHTNSWEEIDAIAIYGSNSTSEFLSTAIPVTFNDIDLADTDHTVSITSVVASGKVSGLALTDSQLIALVTPGLVARDGVNSTGSINMGFSAPSAELDYLSDGDVLTLTYTVEVDDGDGGVDAETFEVNIIGTNDVPTITAVAGVTDVVGAVTEDASVSLLSDSGTVTFDDVDLADTHIVSVVKVSGTLGGTFELGDVSQSASTSSGSVPWTYTVDNSATQYLAAGQTASEVFKVIISDGNGGEVTQNVTITATGTNDAPVITSTNLGSNYIDTSATDTFSISTGTLIASDVDAGTTLVYGISGGTASGSTITKVGAYGSLSINSATGAYTYTPNDSAINALSTNAIDSFTMTVSDGALSATTNYTVTLNGVNDTPSNFFITTTGFAPGSGGVVTQFGDDYIHTFTSSGISSFVAPSANISTSVLVVGGGGGGSGGGGGGGGVVYLGDYLLLADQTYSVFVGAGGASNPDRYYAGGNGSNGQNSYFDSIVAYGGGGGGGVGLGGSSGASSGGAGPDTGAISGAAIQGYPGANGAAYDGYVASGGGGGAGGPGTRGLYGADGYGWATSSSPGGNGGIGLSYDISGIATFYGGGGGGGPNTNAAATVIGGVGGLGGGGDGAHTNNGQGVAGLANTGGGGGGGDYEGQGAAGGSGIVIVRYTVAPTESTTDYSGVLIDSIEDTVKSIRGIQVSDGDTSDVITVTFTHTAGTLSVATNVTNGLEASAVSGSGTDTLILTGTAAQINATLAASSGLIYTPTGDFNGSATLTMISDDGAGGIDIDTLQMTVSAVNDIPVITSGLIGTVAENAAVSTVIYTAVATDADDGDTATYSLKAATGDIGLLNIDAVTGAVTLKASADYETKASYSFTVVATDVTGLSVEQDVTVAVTNVNEAPVLSTVDLGTTYTDTSATDTFSISTGTLIASDVDAGTALVYGVSGGTASGSTITKVGTYGTLSINSATGAYTYTPNDSAINALSTNAIDAFTMTVSDGALSATTNYTVALNGVAEAVTGSSTIYGSLDSSDRAYAGTIGLNWSSRIVDEYRISYADYGSNVSIDTFGSSFDTTLHVLKKDGSGILSFVTNNDDWSSLQSYVSFTPVIGYTYQVYVGSYADYGRGSYVINAANALLSFSGGDGTTPLILDLNYDGVRTLGIEAGVQYDITGAGLAASVGWSSPEDGFLVRDINHDGLINDGTEMFGEATVLSSGASASNGFEALADIDANRDGKIDSQDDAFASLSVWRDTNSDGVTDTGELLTLAQLDIASLNLNYTESDRIDNGNQLRMVSDFTKTDGSQYEMVDVWLTTFYETQSEAQMNAALDAYVGKSESVVSDRNITSGDSSAESNYDDEEFIQNTILLNSAFTTTIEEELVNLEAQKT